MIELQPMQKLTKEEAHGEILILWKGRHHVFTWDGSRWFDTHSDYPADNDLMRIRGEGWRRLR